MSTVRDTFDVAFDRIVTALTDYATAEAAIDSGRNFEVIADNYRRIGQLGNGAYVLVYLGPVSVDTGSSGSGVYYQQSAEYYLDCVTKGAASSGKTSAEQANVRLRYLITQALRATHDPDNWSLGFNDNEIQRDGGPRVEPLPPDALQTEGAIAAARVTFSLTMGWEPTTLTGQALSEIYVDADRWTGLYTIGD
jgi:hypothetical protein